jgi:hypothetical protein
MTDNKNHSLEWGSECMTGLLRRKPQDSRPRDYRSAVITIALSANSITRYRQSYSKVLLVVIAEQPQRSLLLLSRPQTPILCDILIGPKDFSNLHSELGQHALTRLEPVCIAR